MKSLVREGTSLVVGLVGIVLLGLGLNQVLDIGSCASGGPYVIARPCPEGHDSLFWLSFVGALMWIAAIIASKHNFVGPGAGQILWTVGFAGGGIALLLKVLNQESMPPDARLGASIVAAVNIPMGLVVGIIGIVQLVRQRRKGQPRRRDAPAPAAPDTWSRMKTLNALRSTGALTRAEFDLLKADLTDPAPAIDRVALIRQLAGRRTAGEISTQEFEDGKREVIQR
ncbi:SHOCT domain-containing protein [Catellatospora methionotrophica]|uniref:SHOCT domain-containing protein n=1 Tax=Catellatospora methionotrophica TaxID=121620 RepID=UPI00340DAA99